MNALPLKAYLVSHRDEDDGACIEFASGKKLARRLGASTLNCPPDEVTCTRASVWDSYADQGKVPVGALLEAGWWFECAYCCQCVTKVSPEESLEGFGPPLIEGDHVFCCADHQEAYRERQMQRQQALDAGRAATLARWPGVAIQGASTGWLDSETQTYSLTKVRFTFPGGRHAAEWRVGTPGPNVAPSDQEAWARFERLPHAPAAV